MVTKCLFKKLELVYSFPHRPQKNGKLKELHLNGDQVSFQNTRPNWFISTQVTKNWKAFTRMATKCLFKILNLIYLFPHRSQKIKKAFTWMATKCPFKILNLIYLFPHRSQKIKKAFTWMATKSLFKILNLIYLFPHRPQKNGKLKGFHLNGDQVPFQNTQPNLFVSTEVKKELKIGRLSPEWRPSVFSKYLTSLPWMATECIFKILNQIWNMKKDVLGPMLLIKTPS